MVSPVALPKSAADDHLTTGLPVRVMPMTGRQMPHGGGENAACRMVRQRCVMPYYELVTGSWSSNGGERRRSRASNGGQDHLYGTIDLIDAARATAQLLGPDLTIYG